MPPHIKRNDPLIVYFAQYTGFEYNRNGSATSEFYRMCDFYGWERNDDERDEAFAAFRIALTRQFNTTFGTDANSLTSWQSLCIRLGVNPVPETMNACRDVCVILYFYV